MKNHDEFEARLSEALQDLASEERRLGAPAHIGHALQAAFEERHHAAKVVPFPSRRLAIWGLAAAAMIAVFGLAGLHWWRLHAAKPIYTARAVLGGPVAEPPITRPNAAHPIRHRSRPRVRVAPVEPASLSLGLLAGDGAAEVEQILRMRIPRATLRLWGVPVREDDPGELVPAEVTFGENGVARSIRLLN